MDTQTEDLTKVDLGELKKRLVDINAGLGRADYSLDGSLNPEIHLKTMDRLNSLRAAIQSEIYRRRVEEKKKELIDLIQRYVDKDRMDDVIARLKFHIEDSTFEDKKDNDLIKEFNALISGEFIDHLKDFVRVAYEVQECLDYLDEDDRDTDEGYDKETYEYEVVAALENLVETEGDLSRVVDDARLFVKELANANQVGQKIGEGFFENRLEEKLKESLKNRESREPQKMGGMGRRL